MYGPVWYLADWLVKHVVQKFCVRSQVLSRYRPILCMVSSFQAMKSQGSTNHGNKVYSISCRWLFHKLTLLLMILLAMVYVSQGNHLHHERDGQLVYPSFLTCTRTPIGWLWGS